MYLPDEQDIKSFLAIITAATALYQSFRARHGSKKAVAVANEALETCTYPACGHECETPTKPATTGRKQPKLPPMPGMMTE